MSADIQLLLVNFLMSASALLVDFYKYPRLSGWLKGLIEPAKAHGLPASISRLEPEPLSITGERTRTVFRGNLYAES
jgi:hypothetical protein